jgi:hypothetical protein
VWLAKMEELTKKFAIKTAIPLTVRVKSNLKTVSCGLSHEISSIRNRMILSLILADNFF